ncbi:transcription factor HES-7-like [Polyodon spathula]|uniref:transcription factor HES-7-like n=1 Tax=Polyodon spathula TaxID=7913 RepID=UPI001B7E43A3|nr:transcription factor HES-7-like [Polyodon spathula]
MDLHINMKPTATSDSKRVPKPLMEKRRRDRINRSLETLRVLLLHSAKNEKLRNPKVEKLEILESVVQFLKAELEGGDITRQKSRKRDEEEEAMTTTNNRATSSSQLNYQVGVRTCLLRVSDFIHARSQHLNGMAQSNRDLSQRVGETGVEEAVGPLPRVEPVPAHYLPLSRESTLGQTSGVYTTSQNPGFVRAFEGTPKSDSADPASTHGPHKQATASGVWRPWP